MVAETIDGIPVQKDDQTPEAQPQKNDAPSEADSTVLSKNDEEE